MSTMNQSYRQYGFETHLLLTVTLDRRVCFIRSAVSAASL